MSEAMHERGNEQEKEVDGLRRLAELLRQAHSAAHRGEPGDEKSPPAGKKLRRRETKSATARYEAPLVRPKS
jgi:hypothetical protein